VKLPRVVSAERLFLSLNEVEALADRCGRVHPTYRLVVLFMSYTGVRWGEMAALRVKRIDLMRRRAAIAESVVLVDGKHVWGTPKGHARREVPIPPFLVAELARHVAGIQPSDLVFPGVAGGGPMRSKVFQDAVLSQAAIEIGLPGLVPHGLRHTAASIAISLGADVKVIQTMLGHRSATQTLDQYGHLFADRLNELGDAVDLARRRARARADKESVRSKGGVILNFPGSMNQ
jgi:integrase